MAATVLFINRNDLVQNTIIDGNVQADKLMHFISIAQEIHIQHYLGTDLYNKIAELIRTDAIATTVYETLLIDYVQPMLIHYAMVDLYENGHQAKPDQGKPHLVFITYIGLLCL